MQLRTFCHECLMPLRHLGTRHLGTRHLGTWIGSVLLVVTMWSAGCDRTQELAKQQPAATRSGKLVTSPDVKIDSAALQLLEKCTATYAKLTKYEDAGRVVLSYKMDGQATQDASPLAMAFESPNRLGLKAYRVLAGSTEHRFRMRVNNAADQPATVDPLGKQVVSRTLPKQMDMAWLMSDSVAAEQMSAGLAGSPPQLELLLGREPFRALLEGATSVSMDGEGAEPSTAGASDRAKAGQVYQIVKIMRGSAKYRLWIQSGTWLLRRIELPKDALPPAMLADMRVSDIRLSIELDAVKTGVGVDWSKWQVPSAPLDKLVRYFVAPPVDSLDARLGKPIPAFRLDPVADGPGLDTSVHAARGQIQLLIWLADHPSCRATMDQISAALAKMPATIREQVAVTAVWAEGEPARGTTFENLAEQWQLNMPLVLDRGTIGRDCLGIAEAPTVVVLDRKHRLQFFQERANPLLPEALPEMFTRLVNGENLADTMLAKAALQRARFDAQLWLARASDAQTDAFTPPTPYPPGQINLQSLTEQTSAEPIAAVVTDSALNLWTLTTDGQLTCRNSAGQVQTSLKTDWQFPSSDLNNRNGSSPPRRSRCRIVVDDSGTFMALGGHVPDELLILDIRTSKSSRVTLSGQSLNDFRWIKTAGGSRLAAITDNGRTVLIDPRRSGQHSGQSPAQPLAIIERSSEDPLASGYVILSDGRVEPVIVEDEGGVGQAALAKPVSTTLSSKSTGASQAKSLMQRQLQFTPAAGPWSQWHDEQSSATLARGWLSADEPAVFVLDRHLQQLWHAPLPLSDAAEPFLSSVAHDPVSGQPIWVVAGADSTLHFFRADGALVDHCQLDQPIIGLALLPHGQELRLWIAHERKLVEYKF